MAIADLVAKGYRVFQPVNAASPFDLLVQTDESFVRVQVKYRKRSLCPTIAGVADRETRGPSRAGVFFDQFFRLGELLLTLSR